MLYYLCECTAAVNKSIHPAFNSVTPLPRTLFYLLTLPYLTFLPQVYIYAQQNLF